MKLLRFLFPEKPQTPAQTEKPMKFLIAGLGNIGPEYQNTRHNIGFDVADLLAREQKVIFSSGRYADVAEYKLKGKLVILIKPTTFMNLSGKAVKYWMEKEKILPENVLIITDDLNLPAGKLRLRKNGSDGGHNGLKSIQASLLHNNFPRLRFGIGNEFATGRQVNYVLGEWDKKEWPLIQEKITVAASAVHAFILEGIDRAMNTYNT